VLRVTNFTIIDNNVLPITGRLELVPGCDARAVSAIAYSCGSGGNSGGNFCKAGFRFEAMADRDSHHRAQVCRQRAEQLTGLAMAESYPERRKHFLDLATVYRNAANMMEPQVTEGPTRDSDFWSSTVL
jgi:hypothetical protein